MDHDRLTTRTFFRISALVAAAIVVAIAVSFLLRPSPAPDLSAYQSAGLKVQRLGFADLNGWRADDHAAALEAFVRSCDGLSNLPDDQPFNRRESIGAHAPSGFRLAGLVADWRAPCDEAAMIVAEGRSTNDARDFFERRFAPTRIYDYLEEKDGDRDHVARDGLFTGYFEPEYEARPTPDDDFTAPAHRRPADLISVELSAFRPELAGQRIAGRVVGDRLVPYPSRAEIDDGALSDGDIIAYMRPDDLFFMQIQGSGRLRFADGAVRRVGYDGQNGHVYYAIGRTLIETGAVPREEMSMQAIRDWLATAAPADARALRHENASYIFFRALDDLQDPLLGPLGGEGVQLTPMRSIAIDPRYHAYGAPIWVEFNEASELPDLIGARAAALFIAQDTGGAIRGPVRGDLYLGSGDAAGEAAGRLKAEGGIIVLLPTNLVDSLPPEMIVQ